MEFCIGICKGEASLVVGPAWLLHLINRVKCRPGTFFFWGNVFHAKCHQPHPRFQRFDPAALYATIDHTKKNQQKSARPRAIIKRRLKTIIVLVRTCENIGFTPLVARRRPSLFLPLSLFLRFSRSSAALNERFVLYCTHPPKCAGESTTNDGSFGVGRGTR